MKRSDPASTQKYRHLLIVLVTTFLLSPILQATGIGSIFSALLFLYTVVLILRSLTLPRALFSIYLAIACIAFGSQVSLSLGWDPTFNQTFSLIAQGIFALYLGGAVYWIGQDIFTAPTVTLDTVQGGISVYMLIGHVWALFYGMIATLNPQAFSRPLLSQNSYLQVLHFSFTTLTTLGYGDIVPISETALVLTNLQAIVGQMYPAIFISILVGGYLSRRSSE